MVEFIIIKSPKGIKMQKYLFLAFISLSFHVSATSSPYRGGEVSIELKNNRPCFYIDDTQQKGIFNLVILNLSQGSTESWSYENHFEDRYPTKTNCILLTEKNFNNFKSLNENTPYSATLGGVKKAYNKDFCVKKNSGKLVIQDLQGTRCVDIKPSFWENLKSFLK